MSKFGVGDLICRFKYENTDEITYRFIYEVDVNKYKITESDWFDKKYVEKTYMLEKEFRVKHPDLFI